MDVQIANNTEHPAAEPSKYRTPKRRASSAKIITARQEGVLINRDLKDKLIKQARAESEKSFRELCSLFDKSLEFSTQVAKTLTAKRAASFNADELEVDDSLFTGGVLRDYQREGLAWMVKLRKQALNGILADEMGLGKTAQSIAMICHLVATGATGPFLVLGPLSTIRNWKKEFERFSPSLPVVVLHGPAPTRRKILSEIGVKHALSDGSSRSIFPVVISPYHSFKDHITRLVRFKWAYVVIDEASVIKNHESTLHQCVASLYVTGKLLLTGTPLQNTIRELFNLLHFLLPNIFHDYRLFEGWLEELDAHREEGSFGDGDSRQLVSTMHTILAPFFLRRTKESVKIDLPPKKHIIVYCPLTKLQQSIYKAIIYAKEESNVEKIEAIPQNTPRAMRASRRSSMYACDPLESRRRSPQIEVVTPAKRRRWLSSLDSESSLFSEAGNSNDSLPNLASPMDEDTKEEIRLLESGMVKFSSAKMNNILIALRQTVAHPWLVHLDKTWGGYFPRNREQLLEKSGKMQVFDILLRQLIENGHKTLVFSGFTTVLDLISLYLDLSQIEHFYLSGSTKVDQRQEFIDAFNEADSVFLISTRAGGMGINLTGADTVIFFDTDWNPQMDLQAADRCHRIGQNQRVVIYRLIGKGTVDERILDVATDKRRLEKLVMKCGKFEKVSTLKDLSQGDLLQVLKSVDWDAALDGDLFDPSRIVALADRDLVFKNAASHIEG
ncbi:ATP-dependent DNA helicase DDM1 [Galendromus occidentalis]|uniref:ATP-dependent DNA helicase DDM1 n=1 Tax=Galendromus occidentalis TaxID=34638 RepID=A0AAJ7SHH1_9ACAR|nr:ATP-dependent DNA helicase DDM1 [Galendromus occidentalis]